MAQYTSPRAMGTPKAGYSAAGQAGTSTGSVSLKQQGGEGDDTYKGQKSDMSYPQDGGEGGGKEGKVGAKTDMTLLNGTDSGYKAPGRDLSVTSD